MSAEAGVGGSNSVVESQPSKLLVAGSIPVSRSIRHRPLSVHAGYGEMPRRSGEAAKEGSLRSRDTNASFGSASQSTRRKVVWGS